MVYSGLDMERESTVGFRHARLSFFYAIVIVHSGLDIKREREGECCRIQTYQVFISSCNHHGDCDND